MSQIPQRPQYIPPPRVVRDSSKPKQTINRRKRERMDQDAEYNACAAIYLEQNPYCVLCPKKSRVVHHICSGTAGRAASLNNPNTWLENCGGLCHTKLDAMPFDEQVSLKLESAERTIRRLRA